ncbi:MAG: MFS transporter [Pseudomonadota bacterium]
MDGPSPLARAGLVLALWGAGLAAAAQFAKISVVMAQLQATYPDAGLWSGFVLSVISAFGVLFGVVGGTVVARLGTRRVLIWSLALGATMSGAQSFLPPLWLMLVLRTIEGVSHLGIVIAAPTLIAALVPGRGQGAAMTLWGSFFGVSYALTAWVGVPLVGALGLPSIFLVHGALMLAFGVLLWRVLPAVGTAPAPVPGGALAAQLSIYRSPYLGAPALGWLFYTLTFVAILSLLPPFVAQPDRAWLLTVLPLAGIGVSLTLGVLLLAVLPAAGVVVAGFALSALAVGALGLSGSEPWLWVVLFGALGLVQGASFAAVPQLTATGDGRALANGAMAQMGNLGNLSGTPILMAIIASAGFEGMIFAALVVYAAGGAVHLALAARRGSL